MPLDEASLARACGSELRLGNQLCRRELNLFKAALAAGGPVTVSCTREAPLFTEVAEEVGAAERVAYADIRETAGWAEDCGAACCRGRADAGRRTRRSREQGRGADLWPRRGRDRCRRKARRSPRCDGAVDETGRDRAAPRQRFPGAAGHDR